jgi:hypothetical protein
LVRRSSATPSRSLSRTVASSPHKSGEGISAGGGTCLPMTLNIWPTKPPGVQLPITIRPPGRHTRTSSAATRSGRGANIAPKRLATTSKEAFS